MRGPIDFLLTFPLVAFANPIPEPVSSAIDGSSREAKCSKVNEKAGGCNHCIVNARPTWEYDHAGQQFRCCYFSMVDSDNGAVQTIPDGL